MNLDNKYQIEKACSTDPTRYVLQNVYITEDKKHLIATTGRILAKVPVTIEETDDRGNGLIPGNVIADARKKNKRGPTLLNLNGSFQHLDGVSVPRTAEGPFPRTDQVIPKNPVIKHTVTLNPELLLNLAKALGDKERVTLEFQDQSGDPAIIVRNGDAYGLIMPLRA
jgi:DNA polymerase III sliding clamp (beta) subunit (PCNA family)